MARLRLRWKWSTCAVSQRPPLRLGSYAGQRAARDRADESGADHRVGGEGADDRPAGALPFVNDADVRFLTAGFELPLHIHSPGDAVDVAVVHRGLIGLRSHIGDPPRGPAGERRSELAPGSHFDASVAESVAVEEADLPVMRKDLGPALDVGGDVEAQPGWCAHRALVHGSHLAPSPAGGATKLSKSPGWSKVRAGARSPVTAMRASATRGARLSRSMASSARCGLDTTAST